MNKLLTLNAGDLVEIIAPASRCSDKNLRELEALLLSWQLNYKVADDIFGQDLLCANTDEARFNSLKNALLNPQSKAVVCARGGYGSARLITELEKVMPPASPKLFVGMSDITALNVFLQQRWGWPTVHAAPIPDRFSQASIAGIKSILFAETHQVEFVGTLLNAPTEKDRVIEAPVTGGNLSILQTSIGTSWQVESSNKILFIEEVGERGYRIDRMLEHLRQARIFEKALAIVLGDFIGGAEPDGSSLVEPVLERFARTCEVPVVRIEGVGHGTVNFPLPLGTTACLALGNKIRLTCAI